MKKSFEDEVHVYQTFVRNNFSLLGSNYKLIQEQYAIKSGIIDMLAYDMNKECLVIIELKNVKIKDTKVLSQVMRYYNELKDKYIENYIITNLPEIIIIAPDFANNFFIYNNMPIKLIQMYYDNMQKQVIYLRFFPHTEDFSYDIETDKKLILTKKQKTILISKEQQLLIDKIINNIKNIYKASESLKIINYDDHIDILNGKIIAKIIFSKGWFDNTVQLNIYKNYKQKFDATLFTYDPAVYKAKFFKTLIKLTVIDVPSFLKR